MCTAKRRKLLIYVYPEGSWHAPAVAKNDMNPQPLSVLAAKTLAVGGHLHDSDVGRLPARALQLLLQHVTLRDLSLLTIKRCAGGDGTRSSLVQQCSKQQWEKHYRRLVPFKTTRKHLNFALCCTPV